MTKDKAKPKNKGKSNRKFSLPVPLWMPIVVFVLALSLGGLAIANANMQAFLEDQEAIRIAAHERLLRNHPLEYLDLINQSAEINNIKPGFIAAIILCESSYRRDATSSVNARGLMQLMEDTAGWIAGKLSEGSTYNFDLMYEPEANIRYGTWYLNYLANMFYGDPILVAGAYHAGQGTITNWLANPEYSRDGVSIKLDDMMDGPTKTYIKRVMDAYANYEALYFSQEVSNENQQAS